jgi:hypothetical protein
MIVYMTQKRLLVGKRPVVYGAALRVSEEVPPAMSEICVGIWCVLIDGHNANVT